MLGGDGQLGRDEFLRMLYGAQTSLEVAIGATVLSMIVGVLMGSIAGYYGGWTDTLVSRITEIAMAFPILLFIIALASTAGDRLNKITLGGVFGNGVVTLVLVLGFFGWFYPARIVRAQVLSLREKEFIEAARMVGANDWRIVRSHLLPHLVAPIIVLSTITVAQFILAEAGLSFLGIGIQAPDAAWGNLLATAPDYYLTQPWLMVWPGRRGAARDPRLQPPRRRAARRVRSALHALIEHSSPAANYPDSPLVLVVGRKVATWVGR